MTSIDQFVASIGVNTHVDATASAYGNIALVQASLTYLGISFIRDHGYGSDTDLAAYTTLTAAGISLDLILDDTDSPKDEINSLITLAPFIRTFEGPNEVDYQPITNGIADPVLAAVTEQQNIQTAILNTPAVSTVPLLAESLADETDNLSTYAGNLAYADFLNLHPYATQGQSPGTVLANDLAIAQSVDPNLPVAVTETGYFTIPNDPGGNGVDELTQAKLTLDTLFDSASLGISLTFLYELLDEPPNAAVPSQSQYGLFNTDGTPKLAATALHNLTNILAAGDVTGGTAPSLSLSTSNLPPTGNTLILTGAAGTTVVAIWAEPQIWDSVAQAEIAVPITTTTINFGTLVASAIVLDPLLGTEAIATYSNVSSITVGLTDHPLLIALSAPPPTPVDTTPPTITSISTTPGSGSLAAGQTVAINLTPSEAVTVAGGIPTLTLNDGGTATYDSTHSTATNLVFNYTVQPGDNTADLTVTGSNLNGATITDAAGNAANLAGAVGNPPGILQIDTTPPMITGLSTTPSSGSLAAGQVVAINLTPSEAVTVAGGTPTLALNDGGTATYDAAHSTGTNLVFEYIVQPGDNTSRLAVTGSNLNGATITDPAGNAANLAGAVGSPPGTLQIDTTPPTITSISTSPGTGALAAGQIVAISLTPSEAVTVAGGTPTLTLNDGGIATYDPNSSTPTNLVFKYVVQPSDHTSDLTVTGSNLNGAAITDAAGNNANLAGAVGNPPGILQIDTTPPTITGLSTTPSNGSLAAGQVVAINLTPSEAVTVAGGTPTLALNDGGTATYDAAHSTGTNLVFEYIVQPGDNTSRLAVTGSNLNGATITDPAGNAANLAGAVGSPPGTLQIDTTPPTITSISTSPGTGALAAGQIVAISLTPSEAVTVAGGTPTLTLNDGGIATYDPNSSTPTNLVFKYVVQPSDHTSDLTVTGSNLNGAAITDAAGNNANLAGAVGNPPGILQIDTTPPTITGLSTTPSNGSLAAGQVVAINLTPSEAVTVAGGTPTLALNDGGTATYDAAHSTGTNLVFEYIVQPGDNTSRLAVTGSNLNGATITDPAGNAANLAGAVGSPPGTLQIDTTPPTITSISTSPGTGALAAGQIVAISLTPSEAVTVAGGTPTLTLNDGGIATYDPNSSTPTNLVFKYVVQPGDHTADLTVTGLNLNGAAITDPAGNVANLAGAVGNPPGILTIDSTLPTVTSVYGVVTTPGSGDLGAGNTVAFQVTLTGNATVRGGTPTLTLSDGEIATYDAASSTATNLVFNYTVQPGDNTADLTVTGSNLNGATITDAAGNAANLAGAVGNPPGTLQIDTTPPMITGLSTTPGSGSLTAGQVVAINLTPSEAVTVAGGTPTLTLNDGGTATYDPNSSTATNLVFDYTVQPGQNTSDLTITGSNLNGAAITDAAGNNANLAGAVGNPPGILQIDTDASATPTPTPTTGTNAGTATPLDQTIGVYRFFDSSNGTYFYTASASEAQTVRQTRPDLVPEGTGGIGLVAIDPASNDPNASPVYRFFDTTFGTHFFTASASERDTIIATRPDLTYEPDSVFYEHTTAQAGDTPVYRFFDNVHGTHFYTDSASERATIISTRPDLVSEGIGFYEPAANPS